MGDGGSGPILICGIGSLGQICLERLRHFDVPLICIDRDPPVWRSDQLEQAVAGQLVIGDMRRPEILERAQVRLARSVLLLSSNSTVNLEAALQVRILNPDTTIVVRSSSQQASLNTLLQSRLPKLTVVDPLLLCAGAIAQSLRPDRAPATFRIGGERLRLERLSIDAGHGNSRRIRPLQLQSGDPPTQGSPLVVSWDASSSRSRQRRRTAWTSFGAVRLLALRDRLRRQLKTRLSQPRAWDLAILLMVGLLVVGVQYFATGRGLQEGLFITVALLKGELVDPVNMLIEASGQSLSQLPLLALVTSLLYALLGTVLTSAIVALILDQVLSRRLGLHRRRAPKRGSRTVLLLEGGALAAPVTDQLALDGLDVVRVEAGDGEGDLQLNRSLESLRRTQCLGAGLLSNDLLRNLRIGLELQQSLPNTRLAIVTKDLDAADALGDLLGGITLISTLDLAADAFVATAFGEKVEEVRRLDGNNLLLVRYRVETDDTLHGLSIARLQCGFGVTAVALRRQLHAAYTLLPGLDWTLSPGQELVVLADLKGLRRIERNDIRPPRWRLRYQVHHRSAQSFDTQQVLARHLGQAPGSFAEAMDGAWHCTPALDLPLAEQLQAELRRMAVRTERLAMDDGAMCC